MVQSPGVELLAKYAPKFCVTGSLCERVRTFAEQFANAFLNRDLPSCELQVLNSPTDHSGLGTGTQMGLAVGTALAYLYDIGDVNTCDFALALGRAGRSSVGTHGFIHGGLIVESGCYAEGPSLGPLISRLHFPDSWRFVLVRSSEDRGLSGEVERQAFRELPPVPEKLNAQLCQTLLMELLPAVAETDFDKFALALHKFGRLSGECFSPAQYGTYACAQTTKLVQRIQELGYPGVGQTSWGPTLFVATANAQAASHFVSLLRAHQGNVECHITAPNNAGAVITEQAEY